jgi:hypothetical protein
MGLLCSSLTMEEVTKMFPKLFGPVRIGGQEIKNRAAMTAMGVNLSAAGGVNDGIVAFYEARVMGDAVRGGRIVNATQDAYGQAFVFESLGMPETIIDKAWGMFPLHTGQKTVPPQLEESNVAEEELT